VIFFFLGGSIYNCNPQQLLLSIQIISQQLKNNISESKYSQKEQARYELLNCVYSSQPHESVEYVSEGEQRREMRQYFPKPSGSSSIADVHQNTIKKFIKECLKAMNKNKRKKKIIYFWIAICIQIGYAITIRYY
jgi:hypothetical protein